MLQRKQWQHLFQSTTCIRYEGSKTYGRMWRENETSSERCTSESRTARDRNWRRWRERGRFAEAGPDQISKAGPRSGQIIAIREFNNLLQGVTGAETRGRVGDSEAKRGAASQRRRPGSGVCTPARGPPDRGEGSAIISRRYRSLIRHAERGIPD